MVCLHCFLSLLAVHELQCRRWTHFTKPLLLHHNIRDRHSWKWLPKSLFIIVSSSQNVKRRSSFSSMRIVLMDFSITTFERLVVHLASPLVDSRHHFLTICILMISLPHTSVSYLWISITFVFFTVKNCINARGTHADTHAICISMFVVLLLFVRAERPTKNSVLPPSQTEYFPQFSKHSDN